MIEDVEIFPIVHPTVAHFKFFTGPPGTPQGRAATLVKITASDGTVGWGESVPVATWSYETLESCVATQRRYLAPVLKGLDPTDIEGAHKAMNTVIRPSVSTGMPMAKAGIDLALHDLAGKLASKPLAALWGRPVGGEVTLSWTLNPRSLDEVDVGPGARLPQPGTGRPGRPGGRRGRAAGAADRGGAHGRGRDTGRRLVEGARQPARRASLRSRRGGTLASVRRPLPQAVQ